MIFCLLTADIDECSMFSPCEQECTNTDGSYQCLCTKGFILKSDNLTCQGKNYFFFHELISFALFHRYE